MSFAAGAQADHTGSKRSNFTAAGSAVAIYTLTLTVTLTLTCNQQLQHVLRSRSSSGSHWKQALELHSCRFCCGYLYPNPNRNPNLHMQPAAAACPSQPELKRITLEASARTSQLQVLLWLFIP